MKSYAKGGDIARGSAGIRRRIRYDDRATFYLHVHRWRWTLPTCRAFQKKEVSELESPSGFLSSLYGYCGRVSGPIGGRGDIIVEWHRVSYIS